MWIKCYYLHTIFWLYVTKLYNIRGGGLTCKVFQACLSTVMLLWRTFFLSGACNVGYGGCQSGLEKQNYFRTGRYTSHYTNNINNNDNKNNNNKNKNNNNNNKTTTGTNNSNIILELQWILLNLTEMWSRVDYTLWVLFQDRVAKRKYWHLALSKNFTLNMNSVTLNFSHNIVMLKWRKILKETN